MRKSLLALPVVLLAGQFALFAQQDRVPRGTSITVRTNEGIDLRDTSDGRIYTAVVARDVQDVDGNVLIPRGANAEIIVRNVGPDDMAVDLESLSVEGRRYIVSTTDKTIGEKEGVGKNERTAKYVGGGALLGTIIGAVAGGGKGAAIGAVAGGAAGAGTQTYTRGRPIFVPAETLLTFRLDRPLVIGRGEYERDNGYEREGHHYHRDYYDDRRDNDRDRYNNDRDRDRYNNDRDRDH